MTDKGMIDSLTSLRFFAAFAIVLHHARSIIFPADFMLGIPLGHGVSFFFVLSGFILAHVYSGKIKSIHPYEFYVSRLARIWPAHIFTMLLVVILFPPVSWTQGAEPAWLVTLLNGTLLQAIVPIPAYYFSFNSVSWSISTEMFFYLAFPFLLAHLDKTWHIKLIALLATGGLIATLLDLHKVNYYSPDKITIFSGHGLAYISPALRIQEFFIGILLFKFYNSIKRYRFFNAVTCTILELLSIAAVILLTKKVLVFAYVQSGAGNVASGEFWGHCATGLLFGLIIVIFAFNRGILSKLLGLRFFVILGEISFAIYMLHQIVFRYYAGHRSLFSEIPTPLVFPCLVLVTIVMAYAMWRYVEIPSQKWLKKVLIRKERQPSEPACRTAQETRSAPSYPAFQR